MIKWIIN